MTKSKGAGLGPGPLNCTRPTGRCVPRSRKFRVEFLPAREPPRQAVERSAAPLGPGRAVLPPASVSAAQARTGSTRRSHRMARSRRMARSHRMAPPAADNAPDRSPLPSSSPAAPSRSYLECVRYDRESTESRRARSRNTRGMNREGDTSADHLNRKDLTSKSEPSRLQLTSDTLNTRRNAQPTQH